MELKKPKAILFDFDDTLVSSQILIYHALDKTLQEFGLGKWTSDKLKKWSVNSAKEYFPKFFKERTPEAIEFYRNQYLQLSQTGLQPMLGAIQTLQFLTSQSEEIFIGIVSNKKGELLRAEIKRLGWEQYFKSIIGAGDAVEDKPSIEPLKLALLDSNITPQTDHVWFIGDSHVDMQASRKFNCYSILINEEYNAQWFEPFTPHIRVNDHPELMSLLQKIFQN